MARHVFSRQRTEWRGSHSAISKSISVGTERNGAAMVVVVVVVDVVVIVLVVVGGGGVML